MAAGTPLNAAAIFAHISAVKTIPPRWPWVALLASLVMLAAAHAFETFGRMAPCELCLKAREVYWLAAAVAAAGGALSLARPRASRWVSLLLALIFLGGAALGVYHAGVEWKFWAGPASCTGGHVNVSAADLTRLLNGGPIGVPACDKPAWVFLGISMAGWNAVASLALAGASLRAARIPPAADLPR